MPLINAQDPSIVGALCIRLPEYVTHPPIETVVFGWGVNEDRQLGLDLLRDTPTPKVVEAMLGVQLSGRRFGQAPIVAGSRNTLAIDADGGVWSWGWNDRGTLGHGHRGQELKPKRVSALRGVRVEQVAVNGWHCLALSDTGQVYAWGGNEYLQCGSEPDKRDIVCPILCVPHLKVKQVACGGMHSLALTETGEVWTWGEPWGDFSFRVEREPRPVGGATGIAAVACGAFHNMALSHDGQVYTWGTNDYGQLGNGNTSYQIQPKPVHLNGEPICDIAAGGWHSLALTTSGEVWTWGRGEYGRLGLGDRSGSSKLRPVKMMGLAGHRVVQIAGGGTHTMALTDEGRLFVWGRGSMGRLGCSDKDQCAPVECELPGGHERWRIIGVATGGRHSMVLAMPCRQLDGGNHEPGDRRGRSLLQGGNISVSNGMGTYSPTPAAPAGGADAARGGIGGNGTARAVFGAGGVLSAAPPVATAAAAAPAPRLGAIGAAAEGALGARGAGLRASAGDAGHASGASFVFDASAPAFVSAGAAEQLGSITSGVGPTAGAMRDSMQGLSRLAPSDGPSSPGRPSSRPNSAGGGDSGSRRERDRPPPLAAIAAANQMVASGGLPQGVPNSPGRGGPMSRSGSRQGSRPGTPTPAQREAVMAATHASRSSALAVHAAGGGSQMQSSSFSSMQNSPSFSLGLGHELLMSVEPSVDMVALAAGGGGGGMSELAMQHLNIMSLLSDELAEIGGLNQAPSTDSESGIGNSLHAQAAAAEALEEHADAVAKAADAVAKAARAGSPRDARGGGGRRKRGAGAAGMPVVANVTSDSGEGGATDVTDHDHESEGAGDVQGYSDDDGGFMPGPGDKPGSMPRPMSPCMGASKWGGMGSLPSAGADPVGSGGAMSPRVGSVGRHHLSSMAGSPGGSSSRSQSRSHNAM
ncbi:hypothetical protein FOA52_015758 [Chlamydomonas sp. UWO 241]|nr:hypothetical protein FOA52_015758 [Chlamydomonas sp. UWO 241]